MQKEDVFFAPVGAIIIEKAADANLIYGVRKSYLFGGEKNKIAYGFVRTILAASNKNVRKMDQVEDLFA